MYCKKCGSFVQDGQRFCPICGTEITVEQQTQQFSNPMNNQANYSFRPEPSMKWFKFLIYFSLFAAAVLNAINGINLLTGSIYDGYAELVYEVYDGLQLIDTVVGLLSFALAAFCVYTRYRLAGFYQNGPKTLTYLYIFNIVINLVYLIGLTSIVGSEILESSDYSSFVSGIATSIVYIFINKSYFSKREYLFIN